MELVIPSADGKKLIFQFLISVNITRSREAASGKLKLKNETIAYNVSDRMSVFTVACDTFVSPSSEILSTAKFSCKVILCLNKLVRTISLLKANASQQCNRNQHRRSARVSVARRILKLVRRAVTRT